MNELFFKIFYPKHFIFSKSAGLKGSVEDLDESDESIGGPNTGDDNESRQRLSMDGSEIARPRPTFAISVDNELDDRRLRRQIANCNERRRMQV